MVCKINLKDAREKLTVDLTKALIRTSWQMAVTTRRTPLFGDCIQITIPTHWRDVSLVRQVPDNQEVFQDCTEETGGVLAVEILDHQSDVDDNDAARFFFEDLAESNGCGVEEWTICSSAVFSFIDRESSDGTDNSDKPLFVRSLLENINECPGSKNCCIIAVGSQNVVQGKEFTGTGVVASKRINIEMCILRMRHVETDLLITLSTPNDSSVVTNGVESGADNQVKVGEVFRQVMSTFGINDWSLFG